MLFFSSVFFFFFFIYLWHLLHSSLFTHNAQFHLRCDFEQWTRVPKGQQWWQPCEIQPHSLWRCKNTKKWGGKTMRGEEVTWRRTEAMGVRDTRRRTATHGQGGKSMAQKQNWHFIINKLKVRLAFPNERTTAEDLISHRFVSATEKFSPKTNFAIQFVDWLKRNWELN